MPPASPTGPMIRRATSADLPSIGRLGALLIAEHHDFDSRRFLAAKPRTPADYASFLSTQLEPFSHESNTKGPVPITVLAGKLASSASLAAL